jgi:hypothetical protein
MPRSLPEYYSPRDESEAIFYTKENLEAWKITRGALDWLSDQTKYLITGAWRSGVVRSDQGNCLSLRNVSEKERLS